MRRLLPVFAILVAGCGFHAHDGSVHYHTESEAMLATFTVRNGIRYVVADGLPGHETGQFPNRGNPNSIRQQTYRFQMPANPRIAIQPTALPRGPFGVALNGVVFDPGTAEFWNGDLNYNYEAMSGKINLGLDANHAHVQPSGAYHYHGIPDALVSSLAKPGKMLLVGYAADGFPIYNKNCPTDAKNANSALRAMRPSYRLRSGNRSGGPRGPYDGTFTTDWEYVKGLGDLDECNGRTGAAPEFPKGTYYYVLTEAYPFVPRMFKGAPDPSFMRGRGGPPPGRLGG